MPSTSDYLKSRHMTKLLATAFFVLFFAVSASAADAVPAQEPAQTVAVSASGPVAAKVSTCRQEAQTGSSITHKVCRTQEQTEGDQRLAAEAKRRIEYESGVAAEQRMRTGLGVH